MRRLAAYFPILVLVVGVVIVWQLWPSGGEDVQWDRWAQETLKPGKALRASRDSLKKAASAKERIRIIHVAQADTAKAQADTAAAHEDWHAAYEARTREAFDLRLALDAQIEATAFLRVALDSAETRITNLEAVLEARPKPCRILGLVACPSRGAMLVLGVGVGVVAGATLH